LKSYLVGHIQGNGGFVEQEKNVIEEVARAVLRQQVGLHGIEFLYSYQVSIFLDFYHGKVRVLLRIQIKQALSLACCLFSEFIKLSNLSGQLTFAL